MGHHGTGAEKCLSLKATEQRMSNPVILEPAYRCPDPKTTIASVVSLLYHAIESPSVCLSLQEEMMTEIRGIIVS
jgi:hypothetical protein